MRRQSGTDKIGGSLLAGLAWDRPRIPERIAKILTYDAFEHLQTPRRPDNSPRKGKTESSNV